MRAGGAAGSGGDSSPFRDTRIQSSDPVTSTPMKSSDQRVRGPSQSETWSGGSDTVASTAAWSGMAPGTPSLRNPESQHSSFHTDHTYTSHSTAGRASAGMSISGMTPTQTATASMSGEDNERPLSAPPPPGFGAGAEQRDRTSDDFLWGSSGGGAVKDNFFHHLPNGANEISPSFSAGAQAGSQIGALDNQSSPFSNFAAVLGTGLMESMDDDLQDRVNVSNFQNEDDLLSYHRMMRHAASRVMGQSASPPKHNDSIYSQASNSLYFAGSGGDNTDSLYPQPHPEQNYRAYARTQSETSHRPVQQNNPQTSHGFPWLATSNRDQNNAASMQAEKEQVARRSTTPVQMFPGQQSAGQRRALPVTKDIGMNVVEPDGDSQLSGKFTGIVSQRMDQQLPHFPSDPTVGSDSNRSMKELERGMQNMWSPEAREFKQPAAASGTSVGPPSGSSSISDPATEISPRQAEMDLQPFLWDADSSNGSRTLAILHVSWVRVPEVRSACETFGVLESFRADFSSRGIFFVAFYDIRSAQYAAAELQLILQRLSVMQGSSEEVVVKYCTSLGASSQFDESRIVVSNLPREVNEYSLKAMLLSYGALRSVAYHDDGSCLIEFHNLQDSKQALLELDSSQPWGPDVTVEVHARNGIDRKCGRELMSLIGRWRHGMNRPSPQQAVSHGVDQQSYQRPSQAPVADPWRREAAASLHAQPAQQPQYRLGPDGRYSQLAAQNGGGYPHYGSGAIDLRHQQVIQGANGQIYVSAMPQHHNAHGYTPQHGSHSQIVGGSQYGDRRQLSSTPYYAHVVTSDANSLSGRSHRSVHSHGTDGDKDNRHLMMDLDLVEIGQDTRTSLMVRNIPNKYTQQMLLSEFEANGHGPGVIDFFYLPIDFKNRCNRGYAFINFVNYKDILAFHRRYFGKHWRTFNSDKICDITYARIQGKDAMLKRFENSALMEKDDEYKPLVFASDGPAKGTRLPFPDPSQQNKNCRAEV